MTFKELKKEIREYKCRLETASIVSFKQKEDIEKLKLEVYRVRFELITKTQELHDTSEELNALKRLYRDEVKGGA